MSDNGHMRGRRFALDSLGTVALDRPNGARDRGVRALAVQMLIQADRDIAPTGRTASAVDEWRQVQLLDWIDSGGHTPWCDILGWDSDLVARFLIETAEGKRLPLDWSADALEWDDSTTTMETEND